MNPGLLLSDDLLFISRVQGHARAAGLDVKSVRTADALLNRIQETPPPCVMIDVHLAGGRIQEIATSLKALTPPPMIVGYGSHVAAAQLAAARQAGCDLVVPNSKFVERLATDLPQWLSPTTTQS